MDRRAIAVSGLVQGVGFRPFVYGLAAKLGLHGFVRNQTDGVLIEVEGEPDDLDRFLEELTRAQPTRTKLDRVTCHPRPSCGERGFRIETSDQGAAKLVFIPADRATCDACVAELFDPADRRFRYPFLNCVHCGPRLTIIERMPYDRERTTMARFPMCPACRAEYDDPANRRFHAQATACATCGPRLQILDAMGAPIQGEPLGVAVRALADGRIVAIKGLGGYHLACRGDRATVIAELRCRKHRDEKPLALMVAGLAAARRICAVSEPEENLLVSPERPIVLLRKRRGIDVADKVAPRNSCLGVMLPYTPLHHVLLHDLNGVPLVLTSGNCSDEPIAYEDADALTRLTGIADMFLIHDRPIHIRCDDSVTRVSGRDELPVRRSRGYAPRPITLPHELPRPTLALGGQLKSVFALGRGEHAFLSHHLGDLDHYEAYRAFAQAVDHYQRLWGIDAELLVHDLHPDYASTRFAQERAASKRIQSLAVQHHHAHLASCMAEHGLEGNVLGVIFDGAGLGPDGAIWGGEFLVGGYDGFRRAAHFRNVPMPGGEQAIREPWRMAAAYLRDAGLSLARCWPAAEGPPAAALRLVEQMLEGRVNAPLTSSAGRLFDAVAALAGIRQRVRYEGQAAMELEQLACEEAVDGSYPFEISTGALRPAKTPTTLTPALEIDCRPLIQDVVGDVQDAARPSVIARRFQSTLVEIIAHACARISKAEGLNRVVLSGGVFMNVLLLEETSARLTDDRFDVYRHRRVPLNDGGLCLGQLAIAAATDLRTE